MNRNVNSLRGMRQLPLLRGCVPIIVSLFILWLLNDEILHFDLGSITQTSFQFSVSQWALAAGLTMISFYAVAQYDRLVAAELGLNLPRGQVLHAGWRATAIGQVLGYGLVTGALTRWRALGRTADVSLWDCSRLTAGVTFSFFAGWTVVASIAVIIAPLDGFSGWPTHLALLVLISIPALLYISIAHQRDLLSSIPAPRIILPVIGYTALDTIAAAAVIYILLPDGYVPFFILYAAFLFALAAGMASGLPGGLGAFELCLLTIIDPIDTASLIAAIFGYRMIYYAAPAVLAGLSLIKMSAKQTTAEPEFVDRSVLPGKLAPTAPPEAMLCVQSQLGVRTHQATETSALWYRSRNCDLVLGNPFGSAPSSEFLGDLRQSADRAGRGLCFYKCNETLAQTMNSKGAITFQIGSEALIHAPTFSTEGAARRQLRRKLRKADKAGIVSHDRPYDLSSLSQIDEAWRTKNGIARGFSMGYLTVRWLIGKKSLWPFKKTAPLLLSLFLQARANGRSI